VPARPARHVRGQHPQLKMIFKEPAMIWKAPNDSHASTVDPPLLSEFAGDPDMAELVQMFIDDLPQRLAAIEAAFDAGDLDQLRSLAHQLKGAAGGYGFTPITDSARTVEQTATGRSSGEAMRQALDGLAALC